MKIKTAQVLIFISFTLSAVFIFGNTVYGANNWTYTQDFNSLNNGDLNTQDSWVQAEGELDVYDSGAIEGAKGIKNVAGIDYTRNISAIASGVFTIYGRVNSTGGGGQIHLLSDANEIINFGFRTTGNIEMYDYNGSTWVSILNSYSADTIYQLDVAFSCDGTGDEGLGADQYKIRINGGSWSNTYKSGTCDTVNKINLYRFTGANITEWDNILPTEAEQEQQTETSSTTADLILTEQIPYVLVFFFSICLFLAGFVIIIKI